MATNITFVDYQTVVPADWLNNVNTYVQFLVNKEIIFAQNASGHSILNNTNTTITDWSIVSDRTGGGHFNGTTGIFTASRTGWYRIQSQITIESTMPIGSTYSLTALGNGFNLFIAAGSVPNASNSIYMINGEGTVQLLAGQQASIQVHQNSGGTVFLQNSAQANTLTIEQVA